MNSLTLDLSTVALGVVIKITLVIAAAGVATTLLHRSSAAVRHLIWLLSLGGSVVVLVAAPTVPTISMPLPTWVIQHALGAVVLRPAEDVGLGRSIAAAPQTRESRSSSDMIANAVSRPSAGETAGRSFTSRLPAASLVIAAWALGFLVVLVRCVVAHVAVARLVATSTPVSGRMWRRLVEEAASRMHVRRRVAVVLSDAVGGPVTSGFVRAVVLLPVDAADWDDERRRVVLLHEMAHVARLDYVAQLVATAACALYWFHPAVWFAANRMRMEAEHAADDRVLGAGLTSDRYAMHLVELARRAAIGEPAAVAVGIARLTHIERRVRAMLDTTRSRAILSPASRWVAVAATLAVLVPIAGLRTEAKAAPASIDSVGDGATPRLAPAFIRPLVALTIARPERGVKQQVDSAFEQTVPAEVGGRLRLELDTGGEVTIHGWDEPRARVRVRLAGRNWRDTRVLFERVENGVDLRSELQRSSNNTQTSHRFELWVPRRTDVRLESAGGSLAIDDLEGDFTGHTGGGEINIRGARGHSRLSTGGGDISVSQSNLTGTVSTGGGSVMLSQVSGGLRGSSGSGPVIYGERRGSGGGDTLADIRGVTISNDRIRTVDVKAPESVTITGDRIDRIRGSDLGRLHISKMGGGITVDDAPDGGTVRTGGGNIVIERSGGDLRVSTGGGQIELKRVTGSASASTGAGDIRITVVDENGREHSIDASSGHGTVRLILPRSIDARFELETAYTDNFDRPTRIESDWTLERSESRDWERGYGTPRKFVRAIGGSGRGLIKVTTVNGDVIVRRGE